MIGEGPHPVIVERARQRSAIERPAPEVDARVHQCIIHGNRSIAEPGNARRTKLLDGGTDRDGRVLDEVMWKVPARADRQLEPRVPGERREQVIEKAHARVDRTFARPRLDLDAHTSLARLPRDHSHSTNSSANSSAMRRASSTPV